MAKQTQILFCGWMRLAQVISDIKLEARLALNSFQLDARMNTREPHPTPRPIKLTQIGDQVTRSPPPAAAAARDPSH